VGKLGMKLKKKKLKSKEALSETLKNLGSRKKKKKVWHAIIESQVMFGGEFKIRVK
jgi:hypothetical protein